jgi:hypothetical protein
LLKLKTKIILKNELKEPETGFERMSLRAWLKNKNPCMPNTSINKINNAWTNNTCYLILGDRKVWCK